MNLFWLLVLAHFLGDFPLQTDTIYRLKHSRRWGSLIHIGICTFVNMLLTFPYLIYPAYWIVIVLLTFSHIVYDNGKIALTRSGYKDSLGLFLLDQFLHLATIALLTYAFLKLHPQTTPSMPAFLTNTSAIILVSGFTAAVFATSPLVYYLKVWLLTGRHPTEGNPIEFPEFRFRLGSYVERFFLTFFAFQGGLFWILIPLVYIPRTLLWKQWDWTNVLTSLFVACGMGLLLRAFI